MTISLSSGYSSGMMSWPASPRIRIRPIGPGSPMRRLGAPRSIFAGGASERSGAWPSRACRTSMPSSRAALSTDPIGFTARASCETSLPSVSPKPPGSMKSRCISMMTSAVADQSRWIGSGSATTVPLDDCFEFAMCKRPSARELSKGAKQGPCHCVQWLSAFARWEIFRIFSRLYFEPTSAYSLSEAFATRICLFVERDIACVRCVGITQTSPRRRDARLPGGMFVACSLLNFVCRARRFLIDGGAFDDDNHRRGAGRAKADIHIFVRSGSGRAAARDRARDGHPRFCRQPEDIERRLPEADFDDRRTDRVLCGGAWHRGRRRPQKGRARRRQGVDLFRDHDHGRADCRTG